MYIICHLLQLPQEIPACEYISISSHSHRLFAPTSAHDHIAKDQGCSFYSKTFAPISCLTRFCCNHLIEGEVSEVISQRNDHMKRALRSKLDLIIWGLWSSANRTLTPRFPLRYVKIMKVIVPNLHTRSHHPSLLTQVYTSALPHKRPCLQ